jgi:hypothetical protein
MAISIIEIPNQFNYAKQTMPFLVKSSLLGVGGTGAIDPIEKAFRFVFDVVVQLGTGQYKTYASISIPPRPDNYYALLDASPLIIDALSYDLGTHQQTFASPCPDSIVKFKVYCTERYLDINNNFISGTKKSLGEYYAIDGGGNEGIKPYLIDNSSIKSPLHHHQLIDDKELYVSANEPLTLSWLSRNDLGVGELEYKHGNFGTFSDFTQAGAVLIPGTQTLSQYSGITKSINTTVAPLVTTLGPVLSTQVTAQPTFGNTSSMIFKFTDIDLSPSKIYKFQMLAKWNGGPFPTSSNYRVQAVATGTNFQMVYLFQPNIIQTNVNSGITVIVYFITNANFTTGDLTGIELRYVSTNASFPLSAMNGMKMTFDSATLYDLTNSQPYVNTVEIITDDNTVHVMPPSYTTNIIPLNNTAQSRFDTPIGPYKTYSAVAQDPATGYWLGSVGVAEWYQVRIKNSSGAVIGLSKPIYQTNNQCSKHEAFRLKWKNSLGGWDYYTFTMVSKARTSIERENFKRSRGLISTTSYTEASSDRGYKSLNIKLEDTFTIISDWVGDGTAKWLQDLFTSDEVYLLNPEPFMKYPTTTQYQLEYPVFVQQTDIEFMNNSIEAKLKNFVIDITPAIRFDQNTTN